MFRKSDTHIHFVGIGGIGMSGIAEVLLTLGYRVTGTDLAESDVTRRLTELGAGVHRGHEVAGLADADAVGSMVGGSVYDVGPWSSSDVGLCGQIGPWQPSAMAIALPMPAPRGSG